MRLKPLLVPVLVSCLAACTAILGDFTIGGTTATPDEGGTTDAAGSDGSPSDGGIDAPTDAVPDAPADGGPPTPDGGFLNLFTFGSTNTSPPANMRVAYDGAGNLYILFAYSLANLNVLGTTLTPVGSFDMGLIKLGPTGNTLWVRSYGGTAQEYPGGLAVAPNGEIYISGASESPSIDFGGTAGVVTRQSGRYLGWIAKIDGQTGNAIKAIGIDSPGTHQGAGCQALAMRAPHIVAMCTIYAPAVFPMVPNGTPAAFTAPDGPTATTGFVVADLDSNLNARWVNAFGSEAQDFPSNLTVAGNGDTLFAANLFGSGTTFSDAKGTVGLPFNGATQVAVVGRLAAASGAAVWVKAFGGDSTNNVTFNGIDVDKGGRSVIAGGLTGTMTLGTKSATSAGASDVLLAAFEGANGNVLDLKVYGGGSLDEARAVAFDQWSAASVVGTYRSTGMSIDDTLLPDPLGGSVSGFMYRNAPDLKKPLWVAGFTTALSGTLIQGWSIASDPISGRVAAAGTFKGVVNFGDNNPVRSDMDGGAYNVWVVQRRP